MQNIPSTPGLVQAVAEWLEGPALAALDGADRFHARVAANVLRSVERELRAGPSHHDLDRAAFTALLPPAPTLDPNGTPAPASAPAPAPAPALDGDGDSDGICDGNGDRCHDHTRDRLGGHGHDADNDSGHGVRGHDHGLAHESADERDEELVRALARSVRDGVLDASDASLLAALHGFTVRRLALTNPGYLSAADRPEPTPREDKP
ncbi:DUF6285 domain-containing protein [Actinocorallia sp. A-T 12471]|uniref:DUF6285 domain-containing protein n=1 Tax=Actinocorallia sp. A-T 12471 TaxID=3089813 RepID=UPI0029CE5176|nr:DUF6285 domain-containing protein [Actinocorallia sp. A-T 12471]MDX6742746.1 DUF6285 domain-containing protein [Actinocorallia sp. A-T 12471]